MTIMIMSDLHYERDWHHGQWEGEAFEWVLKTVNRHTPEDLVILGDTGYGWTEEEWERLLEVTRVHAIYGNHDNYVVMASLRNLDRNKVLPRSGEARDIQGLRFGFINGIMHLNAKKKPLVPRLTPNEYLTYAEFLAPRKVDVLCTHASPNLPEYGNKFGPTPEFEAMDKTIRLVKPVWALSGHLSGPYTVGHIEGTTCVRVDSSPREKCYLLFHPKAETMYIYHDLEQVEEVTK